MMVWQPEGQLETPALSLVFMQELKRNGKIVVELIGVFI
jgi:hypothetical protein